MTSSPATERSHVFVSYAAEDRPAAERVVTALASLGWQVWWDRELLPGKAFDERIADRLRSAGAVVVLWSRHSVASEWVREEASDAKQRDVLIPAFIEPVDPPFGFKLRHAIDLTAWEGAAGAAEFSALIAAVTALVPPDSSAVQVPPSGSAEPRGWRIAPAALMLVAVAVLGAGAGLWYWDAYHRIQTEYFANVTKRHGLPEGVGRLDAAAFARRNVSLALVRHGRRNPVNEVRLVNSSGRTPPTATYTTPPSFADLNPLISSAVDLDNPLGAEFAVVTKVTFTLDAGGRVLEQSGLTAGGRAVYTLHYGSPEVGEYKRHGFASPIRESGIAFVRFSRLQEGPNAGRDEKVGYLDSAQRPQPVESGDYGYRVVFDERGLKREIVTLGADLEDSPDNYGLLKVVQVFDAAGNVTEISNLGKNGEPVLSRLGSAGLRSQYDGAGNAVRFMFHDRNGSPVTIPSLGAAGAAMTYDEQGRLTSQTLLGPDQRPAIGRIGFAKQTFEWPTASRSVIRTFGPSESPLPVFGAAFEVVQTWDERGLAIETTYRDGKGQPTRVDNGCSTVQIGYDAAGNIGEYRCLNEDRAPTIALNGSSTVRMTSDERGNPLVTRFFDRAGKPGIQGERYAAVRHEYTAAGKVAKETYLDASGSPTMIRQGYAGSTRAYDTSGNLVREQYFDGEGRPVVITARYAAYVSEFDQKNRETRTLFLGTDDRLSVTEEGYAAVRREMDERGSLQGITYLDQGEHPVKSLDGYAGYHIKRNERGQALEVTYLDERGQPMISGRPGSARRRFTYDPFGRLLERADLDINGKAMTNGYGYSVMRYAYDALGREAARQTLDVNGRVLNFKIGVDKVTRASVAAESGFRAGDILLTYDGEAVTSRSEFANRLELFKGDRPREVTVQRGGQVVALNLPAGRMSGLTLEERAIP